MLVIRISSTRMVIIRGSTHLQMDCPASGQYDIVATVAEGNQQWTLAKTSSERKCLKLLESLAIYAASGVGGVFDIEKQLQEK